MCEVPAAFNKAVITILQQKAAIIEKGIRNRWGGSGKSKGRYG
jgi:hypothetical protein